MNRESDDVLSNENHSSSGSIFLVSIVYLRLQIASIIHLHDFDNVLRKIFHHNRNF